MGARRRFLRQAGGLVAAAALPLGARLARAMERAHPVPGFGELLADPAGVLDLPPGFAYAIISRAGERMDDGLRVPDQPDGMHAFPGPDGTTVLLRNHELDANDVGTAFGDLPGRPTAAERAQLYDPAGCGGVTAIVYDTRARRRLRQFLVLGGTLRNCAGGATPWASWISSEEIVLDAGERGATRPHGFNFEVPARARGLVRAVPLAAMGRFNHEAVAVDPATGIAYQTEDRPDGLLYRFLPRRRGRYADGGTLQALRLRDRPGAFTGNHGAEEVPVGVPLAVDWVALEDVAAPGDSLRLQGRARGAAAFARGEGMTVEHDAATGRTSIWFVCTAGGANRRGQLWRYHPGESEGGARERPGTLELFAEPNDRALLDGGDNLGIAANGDLLLCEDAFLRSRLLGVTPAGGVYVLAACRRWGAELAGATFSPDGGTLFVNVQQAGLTLAVTGPWHTRRTA